MRELDGLTGRLRSSRGDFGELWALRRELSQLESEGARDRKARRAVAVEEALGALQPGDVIALPPAGRRARLAAVVGRSVSKAGAPLVDVVTDDRESRRLGPRDLDRPPEHVGRIALPQGHPRQPAYRRGVQRALEGLEPRSGRDAPAVGTDPAKATRIGELRAAIAAHPVSADPQLPELEELARRADELRRAADQLERGVRRRTRSLVDALDKIVGLLTELGYLDETPRPTADGLVLAGLYGETDLVLAEALRDGVLDDLSVPELAAVVSTFTFETRGPANGIPPAVPTRPVGQTFAVVEGIHARISAHEQVIGLPSTRPLDAGFAAITWRWASGQDLDEALAGSDLTPGDFVRATKQVADVLGQIADTRRGAAAGRAHDARRAIVRGVVAYAGL